MNVDNMSRIIKGELNLIDHSEIYEYTKYILGIIMTNNLEIKDDNTIRAIVRREFK